MQEYKSSKSMTIFGLMMCSVFLLWLVFMLTNILLPKSAHSPHALTTWLVVSFLLLIFLSIAFVIVAPLLSRLIIAEDSVSFDGPFKRWEINFSEIRGYRIRDKFLLIEPISKDKKRINIRLGQAGTSELIVLLESKFADLDLVEKEEEHQAILDDPRYGKSIGERREKLDDATGLSKLMNATGVLILLLSFIPKIEKYIVAVAIAAPLVFIIVVRSYNGLIRIAMSKNSAYPSIPFGLFAILVCLIARCLRYKVLNYQNVWMPALLVGMIFITFLLVGSRDFSRFSKVRFVKILIITLCSYVYGFSTIVAVNCVYDSSNSRRYQTTVLDKWVRHGKGTRYNLKIARWHQGGNEEVIGVSRLVFESVEIEDPMNVYVYEGILKIPWYVISVK
jgi:hypothetical protein